MGADGRQPGYTKDVVLDRGIEDGKFSFIAKPLSLNNLINKIREVLDRR
ncbi:MAG: hypothetical protein KA801_07900 [Syntrophorhabdaceae bacterium]|nr:hypothetical protein [Syntrophorhabdaceae bacterium]